MDNVDKFVDKNDEGVISLEVARDSEVAKNGEKVVFDDPNKAESLIKERKGERICHIGDKLTLVDKMYFQNVLFVTSSPSNHHHHFRIIKLNNIFSFKNSGTTSQNTLT